MNLRPIQVYLDSSDYSDFTNEKLIANDQLLATAKSYLRERVLLGDIEIRYSMVIVAEIAHSSKEHKKLAISRAQCIKDLCGSKVLRVFGDLFKQDVLYYLNGHENSDSIAKNRVYAYSDTGKWMPDFSEILHEFRLNIPELLDKEIISSGHSRNERRRLKKLYLKNGKVTKKARELFLHTSESLIHQQQNMFPASDEFWRNNYVGRLIAGKIEADFVATSMEEDMFEIENFIRWYVDRDDGVGEIAQWLRNAGHKRVSEVLDMREKALLYAKEAKQAGYSNKQVLAFIKRKSHCYESLRKKLIEKEWGKNIDFFRSHGFDSKLCEAKLISSKIGTLPSFDMYGRVCEDYFYNNVSSFQRPREVRKSDAGDLFHAIYAPYVDIFRADSYTAGLLRKKLENHGTLVESSIRNLPNTIESMLKKRIN